MAQFPPYVDISGGRANCEKARNWTIARTLHFLPNGYLVRASTTDDPFAFANELVERHGAQFAHPVFLEDIPDRAQNSLTGNQRNVTFPATPYPGRLCMGGSGTSPIQVKPEALPDKTSMWREPADYHRLAKYHGLHHRFRRELAPRMF